MQISRLLKIAGACAAVTVASLGTANAQLLINPGTFASVPPDVSATTPSGTLIDQTSGSFFASNAGSTVAGTFVAAVYRNGDPVTGTLDFWYQFSTGGASTAPITQFSTASYASVTTAVGYNTTAFGPFTNGTEAPVNAQRTSNGVTVVFDFVEVNIGETSEVMLVRTNSTFYSLGNSTVQGAASANFTTFAPINPNAAAPEPGTMALIGMGMLGMAGVVARRRMKK